MTTTTQIRNSTIAVNTEISYLTDTYRVFITIDGRIDGHKVECASAKEACDLADEAIAEYQFTVDHVSVG